MVDQVKRHAIIAKVRDKPKGSCFAAVANDSGMITNDHELPVVLHSRHDQLIIGKHGYVSLKGLRMI